MSDATVSDARLWASHLVENEHRGPGDTVEGAMYRASQRTGIDFGTFWSLRYRPPKDILTGVYSRLRAAYENETERQRARLEHELTIAKAAGVNPVVVAQIETALGGQEGKEG